MPGIAQGGTIIRNDENLMVQGVKPLGVARAGNVIWRGAQFQPGTQYDFIDVNTWDADWYTGVRTEDSGNFGFSLWLTTSVLLTQVGNFFIDGDPNPTRTMQVHTSNLPGDLTTGGLNGLTLLSEVTFPITPSDGQYGRWVWAPLPTPLVLQAGGNVNGSGASLYLISVFIANGTEQFLDISTAHVDSSIGWLENFYTYHGFWETDTFGVVWGYGPCNCRFQRTW